MTNQEWAEMFGRIPAELHNQLSLVLGHNMEVMIETIFRLEDTFAVFRGRVSGTSDEGRAFFIPYTKMAYLRIEKEVKLDELRVLFGDAPLGGVSPLDAPEDKVQSPSVAPAAAAPVVDQNASARNVLLERIRAAKNLNNKPAGDSQ